MQPVHVVTPLWESPSLSEALGAPVYLKMEALQPVGSFKLRGMGHACRAAWEAGVRRVVCASGGNAGYAVAYAGRRLGMGVTIVVPQTTPERLRGLIRREGATVVEHGAEWSLTHAHANALARQEGSVYIHPFDDPRVWQGHASLIHEMAADASVKPGAVVVAVGGGGLMCGLLQGLHDVGWADVPVVAVETEGTASFAASARAGRLVTLDRVDSVATTLAARTVTPEALAWTQRHRILPWVTSDRAAVSACLRFADDHRLLVEPACGAALSAAYERAAPLAGLTNVVVIVCGGAGVSRELLDGWRQKMGL